MVWVAKSAGTLKKARRPLIGVERDEELRSDRQSLWDGRSILRSVSVVGDPEVFDDVWMKVLIS